MDARVRENLLSDRVHRGVEAHLRHLPVGDRGRVLMAGDAEVDADPGCAGDLDHLQEEVLGEFFLNSAKHEREVEFLSLWRITTAEFSIQVLHHH